MPYFDATDRRVPRRRARVALPYIARMTSARQVVLEGEDDELHPVPQGELGQDAADVRLHRRLAQELLRRDLGVAQATRSEGEDLALACRQRLERRRNRSRRVRVEML